MVSHSALTLVVGLCLVGAHAEVLGKKKKHHHKHHHKDLVEAPADPAKDVKEEPAKEEQILGKMKTLEGELAKKEEAVKGVVTKASGCDSSEVKVVETNPVSGSGDIVEVVFEAPADVVKAVEDQAADPDSKLATGSLKEFLVAKDASADVTPVQEKGIDVDTEMPYGELV